MLFVYSQIRVAFNRVPCVGATNGSLTCAEHARRGGEASDVVFMFQIGAMLEEKREPGQADVVAGIVMAHHRLRLFLAGTLAG